MIDEQTTVLPVFLPGDMVSPAVAQTVAQVNPSVVQVHTDGRGGGAGFVWRADGQILTNQHVVGNSEKATVLLPDGTSHEAQVVARNGTLDLALLQVPGVELPAVALGDSSALRVGEVVIAIGHPWGQRGVVTMGIVSGIGQMDINGGRKAQYIRSDVRLAPGNSGGPLLSARGEVIGINAMIFGGDLSVAIPSHVANAWLAGVGQGARPVTLGVQVQAVELRLEGGERRPAALVVGVGEGSLAERSGLMVGDALLELNGSPVYDPAGLRDALVQHAATALELRLVRAGQTQTLAIATEQAV